MIWIVSLSDYPDISIKTAINLAISIENVDSERVLAAFPKQDLKLFLNNFLRGRDFLHNHLISCVIDEGHKKSIILFLARTLFGQILGYLFLALDINCEQVSLPDRLGIWNSIYSRGQCYFEHWSNLSSKHTQRKYNDRHNELLARVFEARTARDKHTVS